MIKLQAIGLVHIFVLVTESEDKSRICRLDTLQDLHQDDQDVEVRHIRPNFALKDYYGQVDAIATLYDVAVVEAFAPVCRRNIDVIQARRVDQEELLELLLIWKLGAAVGLSFGKKNSIIGAAKSLQEKRLASADRANHKYVWLPTASTDIAWLRSWNSGAYV